MKKSLDGLAKLVNGTVIGDGAAIISDVAKIEEGSPGTISFLANPRYKKHLTDTKSSAVIVPRSVSDAKTNLLQVDDPYLAYREVVLLFYPFPKVTEHYIHPCTEIDESANIDSPVHVDDYVCIKKGARIGKGSKIGSRSYLGENVFIGNNVRLHPGVTVLDRCIIQDNVIIHSGAVIGSDGFGYAKESAKYRKIPQIGNVKICSDVEIGANCTIDRASIGSTTIGAGCKIDNLVQIAHNVVIGENTAIAALTGIAGSAVIGSNVVIGGQAGIIGHIKIGDNAIIGAQAGITKSVPPNSFYFGYPARDHKIIKKREALLNKLPDLFDKLKILSSKINRNNSP